MRRAMILGAAALAVLLTVPESTFARPRGFGLLGRRHAGGYGYVPAYGYSYGYAPYSYGYTVQPYGVYTAPSVTYYSAPSGSYLVQPASGLPADTTQPVPATVSESAPAFRPAVADTSATINLLLPTADAQVWVDGQKVAGDGTSRQFVSPALKPGERAPFTVRVQWPGEGGVLRTDTRQVTAYGGDRVTVDFTRPAPTATDIVPREYTEPKP